MNENARLNVNSNSAEFEAGVEAGLNSTTENTNWQAGEKLGQELQRESVNEVQVVANLWQEPSIPLFLQSSREGNQEDAQDEKDETAE